MAEIMSRSQVASTDPPVASQLGRARCIEQVGDVVVVFDDGSRARWERVVPAGFRLLGIWPDAVDRGRLATHIARKGRLIVVLAHDRETVWALPEELPGLPGSATRSPEPVELAIDPLDWLDEPHRARGIEFVRRERLRHASTPPLARTGVALSDEVDGIAFLLRSPATAPERVRAELPALVEWATGARSTP